VLSRQRTRPVDASSVIISSLSCFPPSSFLIHPFPSPFSLLPSPFPRSPLSPLRLVDISRRGTVSQLKIVLPRFDVKVRFTKSTVHRCLIFPLLAVFLITEKQLSYFEIKIMLDDCISYSLTDERDCTGDFYELYFTLLNHSETFHQ
jgi:hypothetical protein